MEDPFTTDDAGDVTLTMRFVADRTFLDDLESELRADPELAREIERNPVTDPGALGFDMRDLATLLAAVPYGSIIGPLAGVLVKVIKRKRPRRILIQTSIMTVIVESTKDMSEDEMNKLLKRLTTIVT